MNNAFIGKIENVFTVCKYSSIKLHLNFLYLNILKTDDLMRTLSIIVTLASMILSSSFVSEHKYYVSITNIDHKKDSKAFEISIKLTAHDIEKALMPQGDLKLGSDKELPSANQILAAYIKNHFSIWINDKQNELFFVGKEIENDESLHLYFKSNAPKVLGKVKIVNNILNKTFPEQENITYFNSGTIKKNFIFKKHSSIKEFQFK